jgi:hypothetical protein
MTKCGSRNRSYKSSNSSDSIYSKKEKSKCCKKQKESCVSQLKINGTVSNNVCSGVEGGKIELCISGGSPPYKCYWVNERNEDVCPSKFIDKNSCKGLKNVGSGIYLVYVKDSQNNCQTSVFKVGKNQDIVINAVVSPACPVLPATTPPTSTATGSIALTVTGGVGPYTVTIAGSALLAGYASTAVVGQCQEFAFSGLLGGPSSIAIPNCSTDLLPSFCGASPCALNNALSTVTSGSIVVINGISVPAAFLATLPLNAIGATYIITVTDANCCTQTITVPVSVATTPIITSTSLVGDCIGTFVGLNVGVCGGKAPYIVTVIPYIFVPATLLSPATGYFALTGALETAIPAGPVTTPVGALLTALFGVPSLPGFPTSGAGIMGIIVQQNGNTTMAIPIASIMDAFAFITVSAAGVLTGTPVTITIASGTVTIDSSAVFGLEVIITDECGLTTAEFVPIILCPTINGNPLVLASAIVPSLTDE